jgi:energy-coupling factor transporter transmembrane protein EcfT
MASGAALLASFFLFAAFALVLLRYAFPFSVADLGDSLGRTASLALRSLGALWAVQGAAAGADVGALLAAARQLGAPPLLVALLFLTQRQFFIQLARLATVRRSLLARSAGRGVGVATLGRVAAAWLAQAHERAEKLATALVARGFYGAIPTRPLPAPPVGQCVGAGLGLVSAALVIWLAS